MSYDLAVFDPSAVLRNAADFTAWYDEQAEWKESHGYDDPAVATPPLTGLVHGYDPGVPDGQLFRAPSNPR